MKTPRRTWRVGMVVLGAAGATLVAVTLSQSPHVNAPHSEPGQAFSGVAGSVMAPPFGVVNPLSPVASDMLGPASSGVSGGKSPVAPAGGDLGSQPDCVDEATLTAVEFLSPDGKRSPAPTMTLVEAAADWRSDPIRGRVFHWRLSGGEVEQIASPVGWSAEGKTAAERAAFGVFGPPDAASNKLVSAGPGGVCATSPHGSYGKP